MRLIFGLVLLMGLGLAGFAVYMTRSVFADSQTEMDRLRAVEAGMIKTVNVFVVKRKVKYGERLSKEDVQLQRWPVDALPEGIFVFPAAETKDGKPGEELFPKDSDDLRTVWRTMEINEPILAVKVTKPGENVNITSRLKPGMRAFTIKVDVSSSVSGFLRPGDQVDVYWTGRPPIERASGHITRLIQSAVNVIAINQSANDDIEGTQIARTVTVEVSPKQVAALAQAQGSGRLSLSLLGYGDTTVITEPIETDTKTILGIEDEEVVIEEEEKKCYRTERKGTEITKIEIDCP